MISNCTVINFLLYFYLTVYICIFLYIIKLMYVFVDGSHAVSTSPGDIHFTPGYMSHSSFLWIISYAVSSHLDQSYQAVMIMK